MSKESIPVNPYSIRWYPDFRYRSDKHLSIGLSTFKSTEPSVTDKEAYRVSLATLRGQLAQGNGKIDVGSYSLKAGEEYDSRFDFSFLNRKDLTIVELDNYIADLNKAMKEYDEGLTDNIKSQLAKAQKKREILTKETVDKNESVKE